MSHGTPNEILPEFAGFFENARAKRLAFPYCLSCRRFHWYPMPRCPHCRSRDIEWREVSGHGEVASFTRVMHPFDASRADKLPYIVGLVVLADAPGLNFITNIVGEDTETLQVGQAVEPVFRTDEKDTPLVEFRPARHDGSK